MTLLSINVEIILKVPALNALSLVVMCLTTVRISAYSRLMYTFVYTCTILTIYTYTYVSVIVKLKI